MSSESVNLRTNEGSPGDGAQRPADLQESLIQISQVIGRKWNPVIIYYLLDEESLRFNEIKKEIEGVSDKVLSESLADLEEYQIVERQIVDDRPLKVEYTITDIGRSFEPIIRDVESGRISFE